MALVTWSASLATGIREVDEQHRRLVAMINELHGAMRAGQGREMLSRIIAGLGAYALEHFATEERLMAHTAYPALAEHVAEHERFAQKVLDFEQASKENSGALSMEVMLFLRDWLLGHIQLSDQKFAPHLRSKGIS